MKKIILILFLLAIYMPVRAQTIRPIAEIQGNGDATPFNEQTVTIEGIVTGTFADTTSSGTTNYTIFVQDGGDGDPATSDALAVYVGREPPTVAVGDLVEVTGEVIEFFGLTEIGSRNQTIRVISNDNPLPEPVPLDFANLEAQEGMLVSAPTGIVSRATSSDCTFTIDIDDQTLPVLHTTDQDCTDFAQVGFGDVISGVLGPLTFHFDEYKVVQQDASTITSDESQAIDLPPTSSVPSIASGASSIENVLITEVYYTTIGSDDEEEWIEITNFGDSTVDLTDFRIGDEETAGEREGMFLFPSGAVVESGRAIIVAQSAEAFQRSFGFKPNFELNDTDPAIPNLRPDAELAGGNIALANDGDEVILLDADGAFVDGMSYGGSAKILKPPIVGVGNGESLERVPADCDNDISADWQPNRTPDPGLLTLEGECTIPEPLDPTALDQLPPIGVIQGNGSVSPYVNQLVSFEGVVIGFHEDRNTAGVTFYTIFLQDLPGNEDGDPTTSDAIPLFVGRDLPDVAVGDHLLVTGTVTEFFGLTEIEDDDIDIRVLSSGNPLPTPIEIKPPAANDEGLIAYYESLEGMRVMIGFEPARVVGATFSGCGFSVVRQDSGLTRVIRRQLSDPIGQVIPILWRSDVDCGDFPNVKTGDEISGLLGPLTYNFDQYKIVAQDLTDVIVDVAPFPPLPAAPTVTSEQFSVISFNVENFFDGIDDTGNDAEPKLTPEQIAQKQTKIAYAIGTLLNCPTIVAIQEVEKATLLRDLADELAQSCDFTYAVTHFESADGRGIDLAFLTDPNRVNITNARLLQGCTTIDTNIQDETITCEDGEDPLFSRAPLRLDVSIDGRAYILFNNHFKSKRGGELATERRRIEQAQHINRLVAGILAENESARVIVIGDLNDYEQSAPLQTLADGGLFNVLERVPEAERYTFVFSGVSQLIDGLLVSPAVEPFIDSVTILHTNADYPDSMTEELSADLIPYKATDHDIPFMVVNLDVPDETAEAEPTITPASEVEIPTPTASESDNTTLLIGLGVGAMVVAGVGGYWFGRKK